MIITKGDALSSGLVRRHGFIGGKSHMASIILANAEGICGMSAAIDSLLTGGSALKAVEEGIRVVELDPTISTVGFGGAPNILGEVECDASIMCGVTLRTGSVGALKGYFHAISVARQIMERMPHVLLVGEGAAMFAAEINESRGRMLSPRAETEYEQWIKKTFQLIHIPTGQIYPLSLYHGLPLSSLRKQVQHAFL